MTDIVQRAEQALEKTTPGQWEVNREGWACISSGADSVIHAFYDKECPSCDETITDAAYVAISIEDAEFIAAAPELVRELIAKLKRLQHEGAELLMSRAELADEAQKLRNWRDRLPDVKSERDDARAEVKALRESVDEYDGILGRQSDLLTATVNVLRGDPPPLTTWSHHDVAERAQSVVTERDALRAKVDAIRALCDDARWSAPGALRRIRAILGAAS